MVNAPNNAIAPNRAAVIELVKRGVISYSSFDRQIDLIRVYGDTAVVMGSESVRPVSGPAAGQTVQRRFTNIWRNDGGTWRAIARHANVYSKPRSAELPYVVFVQAARAASSLARASTHRIPSSVVSFFQNGASVFK